MDRQESDDLVSNLELEQQCVLPRHPFFRTTEEQASFVECIDAIDRVKTMVALFEHLELDDGRNGLSPNATFGYYWVRVMAEETLSYVGKRLMVLHKQNKQID